MTKGRVKVSVGQKYEKLTVVSKFGNKEGTLHLFWNCKCECGGTTVVRSSSLTNGNTKSCGCLRATSEARRSVDMARRDPMSAWKQLWHNYRKGAIKRNLEFNLSVLEFKSLCEKTCNTCGQEPTPDTSVYNMHKEKAPDALYRIVNRNGIDRVDNSQGYVLSNCEPCCSRCNFAKHAMPMSEFKDWIARAYKHQNS